MNMIEVKDEAQEVWIHGYKRFGNYIDSHLDHSVVHTMHTHEIFCNWDELETHLQEFVQQEKGNR